MANLRADNLTGTGGRNAIDGSVFFDGESSYLTMPDSEDFNIGSSDFTIELWMYKNDTSTYQHIFRQRDSGSAEMAIVLDIDSTGSDSFASGYFQMEWGANKKFVGVNAGLTNNTWHHLALTKEGTTGRVFVNGVLVGTDTLDDIGNYSGDFYVGYWVGGLGYYFKGYISNFRICKGHAIYTANFTPPTQKLDLHAESVLLCCQDSDDPTQEATGKTITGFGNLGSGDDTNLLTNGDFSVDISSWTVAQGSASWSSGKLYMSGTSGNSIEQNVTTVVGKLYRFTATVDNTANVSYNVGMQFGPTLSTDSSYQASDTIQSGTKTFVVDHIAESTTTTADLWGGTSVTGYWSNVSVKLLDPPKAPKVLPPVGIDEGVVLDGYTKINSPGVMYFPTGDTSQRGRGTALFGGGYKTPNSITAIDYLSIQSGGLTQEWGNLSTTQLASGAALSSNTRYVRGGGWVSPLNNNAIEYVTFTTSGNSLEFGDLSLGRRNLGTHSNDTRGLWAGGYISPADAGTDTIDYVTIASTGNAVDFGNLSAAGKSTSGTGSTTRAVFTLGNVAPVGASNVFEYVTIASAGDYTNFGDLEDPLRDNGTCSNGTRAVFAGGTRFPHNAVINTLQFITIASTGDTTNFGDLTLARGAIGGTSNGTRGVFMGGTTNPARQNTIDSIIIATTGEAVNWGEFITAKQGLGSAASDSHGGLS